MDIDDIIKQAQEHENDPSGFAIERDGKKHSLTIGEATDAMEAVLKGMARNMAVAYLRDEYRTSFPDLVIDDMARRYVDKATGAIPGMLFDIVKKDLTPHKESNPADELNVIMEEIDNASSEVEFLEGMEKLKELALRDCPEAQYNVGYLLYMNLDFMDSDKEAYTEAAKWLKMASDNGIVEADNHLGTLYADGKGVEKDIPEAIRLLTRASEAGMPYAQSRLAHIHYFGQGVPVNKAEAYRWYSKAAEQGEGEAQFVLGKMFFEGDPVKKDWNKALEYLEPSLYKGYIDARAMIEEIKSKA